MILLVRDWLLFATVILGGGAALAPDRQNFEALESWCIGIASAVAILAGSVFVTFAAGLPPVCISAGFLVLVTVTLLRRSRLVRLCGDQAVRDAFVAWIFVSAGALALATCVFSYSGGLWMGDWEEHYQRPLQLLGVKIPPEILQHLCPVYFTSRPPLANLAESAFLWITGPAFARHQVILLLLNSLAFLPAAAFARTFGGGRAAAPAAACLFLLNPVFLQNATYAWTKLIVAFFVLLGLHVLFTRKQDRARTIVGFALLTLGVLTHYSACVWFLVFGAVWLVAARAQWSLPAFRRTLALAALVCAALLGTWLAFAIARFGLATTFGANSVVATAGQLTWQENLLSIGPKLWHTLVPHSLRSMDRSLLNQTNPWTLFRDHVFYNYQSNLFLSAGLPALLLLGALALRPAWRPRLPHGRIWLWAVPLTVVLGTAIHGHIDYWGLAHICLQPLALLAVALAAALLPHLLRGAARPLAVAVVLAAVADWFLGVVLHYTATALQLNRAPGQTLFQYTNTLTVVARFNLVQKFHLREDFLMDTVDLPFWIPLALLTSLAFLAAARATHLARAASAP